QHSGRRPIALEMGPRKSVAAVALLLVKMVSPVQGAGLIDRDGRRQARKRCRLGSESCVAHRSLADMGRRRDRLVGRSDPGSFPLRFLRPQFLRGFEIGVPRRWAFSTVPRDSIMILRVKSRAMLTQIARSDLAAVVVDAVGTIIEPSPSVAAVYA